MPIIMGTIYKSTWVSVTAVQRVVWVDDGSNTVQADIDSDSAGTFVTPDLTSGIYRVYAGTKTAGNPYPNSPACPLRFQIGTVGSDNVPFRKGVTSCPQT